MKALYEKKNGQSEDFKKVKQLEEEIQNTKTYYNKWIREIEDNHKF